MEKVAELTRRVRSVQYFWALILSLLKGGLLGVSDKIKYHNTNQVPLSILRLFVLSQNINTELSDNYSLAM